MLHRLSSCSVWDLSSLTRIKPAFPALQGRLLTTGSSGKFLLIFKMDIFIRTLQGVLNQNTRETANMMTLAVSTSVMGPLVTPSYSVGWASLVA